MTRKAERLLNLTVMLLETSRPVGLEQIRTTIPGYGESAKETFQRMFERDKQELREMGIPVEREFTDAFEIEEGYRIPKDRYYLPEVKLEPDELAALWIAAGLVRMKDESTRRSAKLKLSHDSQVLAGAGPSWVSADLRLQSPNLARAFEAVVDRRSVEFAYRSRDGEKSRTVDPYGLVHRKGAWYLTGHDHLSGEVRSFRLDRVSGEMRTAAGAGSGPDFEVPEDFRPEAALSFPPFVQGAPLMSATVRFDSRTAWWAERSSPWLHLEPGPDGQAEASVEVTDQAGFISWVLSFGEGAEVTGPPEMRLAIGERLAEICE